MVNDLINLQSLATYNFESLNKYGVIRSAILFKPSKEQNVLYVYFWGRMTEQEREDACKYVVEQFNIPAILMCSVNITSADFDRFKAAHGITENLLKTHVTRYQRELSHLAYDVKDLVEKSSQTAYEYHLLVDFDDANPYKCFISIVGQTPSGSYRITDDVLKTINTNPDFKYDFSNLLSDFKEIASRHDNPRQLIINIQFTNDFDDFRTFIEFNNCRYSNVRDDFLLSHNRWMHDRFGIGGIQRRLLVKTLDPILVLSRKG